MEGVVMAGIPGFLGIYSITSDGRVYSHARIDARGNSRRGKWLKPIPDRDGYPRVHLCVQAERRKWQIHRLVAWAFIPNPEHKSDVNHKDGDKTNNAVTNLEWATTQENVIHAHRTGLSVIRRDPSTGRILPKHHDL